MPYAEDGETWDADYGQYMEGMAENRPGHKKFSDYNLPGWVKHPLTHPFSGIFMDAEKYAYASCQGTMDGLGNTLMWGPGHVAATFGDIEMLESCSETELNAQNINGETPANYAVQHGTSWVLQWLVEHGCDTTSPDHRGFTPEETIWTVSRNHTNEMEFLAAAEKGELTDKKNLQHQEYKLKRWRCEGQDEFCNEYLDKNKLKQRMFMYKTGDYEMPYPLPTDVEVRHRQDLPSSLVPKPRAKGKPPIPAALLFPGQGSQYVGMLKECVDMPVVKEMLETAKGILGWDVKDLCLNGPESKLSATEFCQPAMFIAGLAAVEVMRESKKETVERCQAVAGLSLGEYTALVAAEVLTFEDGLTLVNLRAKAMQKATELVPQSMCSVAGLDRPTLEKLCKEAKAKGVDKDPECQIANILFPAGFTVAGTKGTIDELCKLAIAARALQARVIKAGGAFHTPLMKPAEDELAKAIDSVASKMQPPRCAIYFNTTGKKMAAGSDPSEFLSLMKKQLTSEVLWEPSVKQMIMDGVKDFYECGPLKQLKSMIKRIDQDAFKRTENISV